MSRLVCSVPLLMLALAAAGSGAVRGDAPMANTVTSESLLRVPTARKAKEFNVLFTDLVPATLGGENEIQEIACIGRVTRGGKPVKGVKARVLLRAFESPQPPTVIRQLRSRSNARGILPLAITDTTGTVFDWVIVQTTLSGSKRVDTVKIRCQYRDYDPCSDGECFGPGNRFQLQSLPNGFTASSPGEIRNGGESWTLAVTDSCKSGAFLLEAERLSGSGETLKGISIVDTHTGLTLHQDPTEDPSIASGQQIAAPAACP